MHVLGASVPLMCLFWHFITTTTTLVDYVVFVRLQNMPEDIKTAHFAFSIIGLFAYGACAAPLFVYSYKYGSSHPRRLSRLLTGIGVMFPLSSLPMVIIELIILLYFDSQFQYPLDGMLFILHAIAAIFGGATSWFAYMRVAAQYLHRKRGPERQIVDETERNANTEPQLTFTSRLPGQPDVI